MKKKKQSVFLAYVMAVAFAWGVPFANAELVCETPEYDFGTLPGTHGETLHVFELLNSGTQSLVIASVHSSCDCLTVLPFSRTLESGQRMPLKTRLAFRDSTGAQLRTLHVAYREASQEQSVQPQILSLRLRVKIQTTIIRIPDRLKLGTVLAGSVVTAQTEIVAGGRGPFSVSAVGVPSEGVSADYVPDVAGTNHLIRFSFCVPVRSGAFSGVALVQTDAADQPEVPILFSGTSAPHLCVSPSKVRLDKGEPVLIQLLVSSPFGVPFRLLSVTATVPDFAVTFEQDCRGARITLKADKCPDDLRAALLRVTTDHPVCRTIEVPIVTRL